jgi:hypothetical protein
MDRPQWTHFPRRASSPERAAPLPGDQNAAAGSAASFSSRATSSRKTSLYRAPIVAFAEDETRSRRQRRPDEDAHEFDEDDDEDDFMEDSQEQLTSSEDDDEGFVVPAGRQAAPVFEAGDTVITSSTTLHATSRRGSTIIPGAATSMPLRKRKYRSRYDDFTTIGMEIVAHIVNSQSFYRAYFNCP